MKRTLALLLPLMLGCAEDRVGEPLPMAPQEPGLPGSWIAGPTLPRAIHSVGAAVYRDRIYVVGGARQEDGRPVALRTVYRLEPTAGVWEELPAYPAARADVPLVVVDEVLYGVGGRSFSDAGLPIESDEVWAFDPATERWSLETRFPVPLQGHNAEAAGDEIMVFAGRNRSSLFTFSAFYDPGTKVWRTGGGFPQPRLNAASAADGERVWVLGGEGLGAPLARADAYDFGRELWFFYEFMPGTRNNFAAAVLDGRVHAMGGISSGEVLDWHHVLDPETNVWAAYRSLPQPLLDHAAVPFDGAIYLLGGRANTSAVADVSIFNP